MPCRLAGLFIDFDLPFLAALPDELVRDNLDMQLDDFTFFLTHPYYYQVQCQLHTIKRQFCYFIAWTQKVKMIIISFFIIIFFVWK